MVRMMGREGRSDRGDKWQEAQGFSLEVCQSWLAPEINFPRSFVKQSELLFPALLCISSPGCRDLMLCGETKRWLWAGGSDLGLPKRCGWDSEWMLLAWLWLSLC